MKRRQIVEAIAAIVFLTLASITVFVPDWIERISPLRPDSGGGGTEWLIVAVLAVFALLLVFDVVTALRRMARTESLTASPVSPTDSRSV